METRYPSQFLAEIRARTRLSEVIRQDVDLVQAGREWKACCPFHKEKTPSFAVNDQKGFYHCFGCGAHGDVIRYLTDKRGLSLDNAVRDLAKLADLRVPEEMFDPPLGASSNKIQSKAAGEDDGTPDRGRNRRGGARLNRSETVTVRLDPILNYLCELAARSQRRTKSSFIEWAVEQALQEVKVVGTGAFGEDSRSMAQLSSILWDVDEADRLVKIAFHAPSLMTHEEQLLWKLIKENGLVWFGGYSNYGNGEWSWQVKEENLRWAVLREHWETFKAVASGDTPETALPDWQRTQLDDGLPF